MIGAAVLGGDPPSPQLLSHWRARADKMVAADRGLEAFGELMPDLILGDMDSVSPKILSAFEGRVPIRRLNPIKDETDGYACLEVLLGMGCDEIVFLGALGGRLDHSMANLSLLLAAHDRGAKARIVSEEEEIFPVIGEAVIEGAVGDTVSLLAMGEVRDVTLEGFFYPLSHGILNAHFPLGISNRVTADPARVKVGAGDLLLFHHTEPV